MKAPLILVVGPSGAGKDSLIDGARRRLGGGFHFARRVVTRPAATGSEDHDCMTEEAFLAAERAGGFLLSWRAHGLAYGIPRGLDGLRLEGVALVANVSRSVVDAARLRLPPVGIVVVTAPLELLARRLAARGREDGPAARRRLCRAAAAMPEGPDVITVVNDRGLDQAVNAFVAALRGFSAGRPAAASEIFTEA